MRILIAGIIMTLAGTSVFLACSSDNTPSATNGDGGTGTSSSSSSGSSGSSSSGDGGGSGINSAANLDFAAIDGGCAAAPPQITCKLHCTGYKPATMVVSTPRSDAPGGSGVAWQSTTNAEVQDGQFATVTLNDGEESASLDATGFGFDLPDTDNTYGVAVEFAREAVSSAFDAHFTLLVENPHDPSGPKLPVDHQDESIWPKTQVGVHHYGQCLDTWELDLSPADVNKATFGARVSVKRGPDAGAGPVTANVDSMRVNVCYCQADGK